MNWREFLKPTFWKILFAILMLAMLNLLFWYSWLNTGNCGQAEEGFMFECVPPPSYILRITLVSFTPFYLVACLVIFICIKSKNREMEEER